MRHGAPAAHLKLDGLHGRHEPDCGDDRGAVDYPAFFARIAADGYDGWVSGEYFPRAHTLDDLDWLRWFESSAARGEPDAQHRVEIGKGS